MLDRVIGMARASYGYVVTPNVDHVIKLMDGRVSRDVYEGADLKICDSRILGHLARMRGIALPVYPGSDMTADLLASPAAERLTIGVFGPDRAAFDDLAALYPRLNLAWIEAPMLVPGTPGWTAAVEAAATAKWESCWPDLLPQAGFVRPRPARRRAEDGRRPVRRRLGRLPDRPPAARATRASSSSCRWNGCTAC